MEARGALAEMLTHTVAESTSGPVILWGMYPFREDEMEHMKKSLSECVGDVPYTLIAFQVSDWNREFSPWAAPELDATFTGEGEATLNFLQEELLPLVKEKYGTHREVYLMGYSLAGLFALWCLTKTDAFDGAASCSGSLWYPGFLDFLEKQTAPTGKRIYLSLGGKESNSRNPLMATVADCTEKATKLLAKENTVKYELNPGGHFADSAKRLAKAVKFLLADS